MKTAIRKFAKWLLHVVGAGRDIYIVPESVAILLPETVALVAMIEQRADPAMSGEFKRHKVFGVLVKAYPELRQRDISLAIEFAVRAINV